MSDARSSKPHHDGKKLALRRIRGTNRSRPIGPRCDTNVSSMPRPSSLGEMGLRAEFDREIAVYHKSSELAPLRGRASWQVGGLGGEVDCSLFPVPCTSSFGQLRRVPAAA